MAAARADDDEIISAINVTPLVDVVLVLLIVLMVTASYVTSRSLPLQLPEAHRGDATPSGALDVTIDASGHTWLDDHPADDAALRARARAQRAEGTDGAHATISADRAAAHGDVVRVIDLLRDEHIARFAIRVREPR